MKGPEGANPKNEQSKQEVTCPSGLHAIGGGIVDGGGTEQSVNEMFIGSVAKGSGATNVFTGFVNNTSANELKFHVWAICATVSLTGAAF